MSARVRFGLALIAVALGMSACGSSGHSAARSSADKRAAVAAYNAGLTAGTMDWQKLVPRDVVNVATVQPAVTKSCGTQYSATAHAPADRKEWIRGCVTGAITSFVKATH